MKCFLRANGRGDPGAPVDVDPGWGAVDEEADEECSENWLSVGDEEDEGRSDRLIRATRAATASWKAAALLIAL
jgi:hypothetical protein